MTLILDLETVPQLAPLAECEDHSGKDARALALSPRTGRILVGGVHEPSEDPDLFPDPYTFVAEPEHHERDLIVGLWARIRRAIQDDRPVVTFNGHSFDFPFLLIRSAILGVDPGLSSRALSDLRRRYTFRPHYDVRMALTNWDNRAKGTLDEWARAFGVPVADPLVSGGADVFDVWCQAQYDTIRAHCMSDLTVTAALYAKIVRVVVP